jgi:hypothetical protein
MLSNTIVVRILKHGFTALSCVLFLAAATGSSVTGQTAREKLMRLAEETKTPPTQPQELQSDRRAGQPVSAAPKITPAQEPTAAPASTPGVAAVSAAPAQNNIPMSGPRPELRKSAVSLAPVIAVIALIGIGTGLVFVYRKRIPILGKMSLSLQVTLVACAAALPLAAVVFLYLLPSTRAQIQMEKMQAVRQTVDVAYNILAADAASALRGDCSQEEAQRRARISLKNLRYNTDDYFFINDLHPTMIMHPFKPELDGKDLSDNKDPNGVRLFVEMANVCRSKGEGVVEYMWPKPGVEKPVPKITYVRLYKPWGWIVGSGVYVEDIEETMAGFQNSVI